MLQLQGASPMTPFEVTPLNFNAAISNLMIGHLENAPAFQKFSAYLTTCNFQNASA